jgi:hypothetical protein
MFNMASAPEDIDVCVEHAPKEVSQGAKDAEQTQRADAPPIPAPERELSAHEQAAMAEIVAMVQREATLREQLSRFDRAAAAERQVMLETFDERAAGAKGDLAYEVERLRASIGVASARVLAFYPNGQKTKTEVEPAADVDLGVLAARKEEPSVDGDMTGCMMGSPAAYARDLRPAW